MESTFLTDIQKGYTFDGESIIMGAAVADGKPQKEYLAFILKQEGDSWKIDRNAAYTKSEAKAKEILTSQERK